MGLRGVGAASRRTGAAQPFAPVCILGALLGPACSIEQPVSGSVALTSEWTTVEPPKPLRIGGKLEQRLCLDVGTTRDVDFEKGVVVLGNGQQHTLQAEAIDSEQTTYPLRVVEQGKTICLSRAGDYAPGPDFPMDRTIVMLRVRSEPPLRINQILWHSYDPH